MKVGWRRSWLPWPRAHLTKGVAHKLEFLAIVNSGTLRSVAALKRAIAAYVTDHNKTATPFIWTKPARTIIRKINKCHAIYGG
jgi:hypothetical protein